MEATKSYSVNVLSFSHPIAEKQFAYSFEKQEGFSPLLISELPRESANVIKYPDGFSSNQIYVDFTGIEKSNKKIIVNFAKSANFAKRYYLFQISEYFKGKAYLTEYNFIGDLVLYFRNTNESTRHFASFDKFTIKCQIARITTNPEILISYSGTSKVLLKNVLLLNSGTQNINYVVYDKQIYKYSDLIKNYRPNLEKVFPLLNNSLTEELNIVLPKRRSDNKYLFYFNQISWLLKQYINTDEFKQLIPITSDHYINLTPDNIFQLPASSRNLVFQEGEVGISPKYDIYNKGPFSSSIRSKIEIFLLYHSDYHEYALQIENYFNNSVGNWKGMKTFSNLSYSLDINNSIVFSSLTDPMPEIINKLIEFNRKPDTNYLCIYITPFSKYDPNVLNQSIYYKIKFELLIRNIVCQAIKKETFDPKSFPFSLRNIGIAILAKLGGIPWRLQTPVKEELIIGVGAYKSKKYNTQYLGSAFCFKNDGTFTGFDCFSKSNPSLLAGAICSAVQTFIEQHKTVNRVIIHFYKQMNKTDYQHIQKTLRSLKQSSPVIVIIFNKSESSDIVFFDNNVPEKIPESGAFINAGNNQMLLCNNSRYGTVMPNKIEGFPFPIKLTFWSSDPEVVKCPETVHELVNQAYQFSRLNWCSVIQQNLPVTVSYPSKIAQMFPHFQVSDLPDFAKQTLWFL